MVEQVRELISQGMSISKACQIVATATGKSMNNVRTAYYRCSKSATCSKTATVNGVANLLHKECSKTATDIHVANLLQVGCSKTATKVATDRSVATNNYIREKRSVHPMRITYSDLLSTMYI
jgi:hypothetical protein